MRFKVVVAVSAALAVAALIGGTAAANSVPYFETNFGLAPCVAAPCYSTLPANEPFSVRGGFAGEPRADLVNPQHRFELTVDGVPQQGITDLDLSEGTKWSVYNFRQGMTGVHTFVGSWYGTDGSLVQSGTRTVTFT
jgi:hypothetical protein